MGIIIEDLSKLYQNGDEIIKALDNVSFHVENGEFIAIIGPSGSGKSTLMNIIGCLDRPSRGKYLFNNQNTSQMTDNKLAEIRNRHIGFIFQSFNLLPQYTAWENVKLPLLYNRSSEKSAKTKIKETLDMLGLADRANHRPAQLSGGQKQRVAIARAIINSPSMILADEPTGSLDSKTGQEVLNIFQKLNQDGKTIIIITHDLNVAKHASRIFNIKDGLIEELKNEHWGKLPQ